MTDMLPFETVLRGKKIFVTGHSGFTGSWLSTWFDHVGVEQYGYSLAPDQTPALADLLGVAGRVPSETADIMDHDRLAAAITRFQPDDTVPYAERRLQRRPNARPQ